MATTQTGRFVNADGLAGLVARAIEADTSGLLTTIVSLVGNVRDVQQAPDGSWPTITRRSWLSYRWVASADPNRLPARANGALPRDQFVGLGEAFLPTDLT